MSTVHETTPTPIPSPLARAIYRQLVKYLRVIAVDRSSWPSSL